LSDLSGADVGLKLESAQHSHSFKWRGAFNAVIARLERGTPKLARLVTASAGNHGRALAAAAETFGLPLSVFTPAEAPQVKLMAIARHGAELRACPDYDEAERRAKAFASETGAAFISPYSDPDVIAGAATVALEIFEDAADTDMLLVPIGGGGLISGAGAVAKTVAAGAPSSASRSRFVCLSDERARRETRGDRAWSLAGGRARRQPGSRHHHLRADPAAGGFACHGQ
jgi:threonine dehydratase